ncbi:hypothetical protein ACROYT_G024084 [Oculina patagonica]
MEKSTLVSPTNITGNFSTTIAPTNGTLVDKYAGKAIAYVTGSTTGMVVGILIAIVIVIIIVLCVRQAYKGLKEAKEKALLKLNALIKREESVDLPDAAIDMELSAVQPASANKKKLDNLGKIKFSLAYDEEQSELRVKVYYCKGLPMKFVGGTVYTYVEVEMFPFHRMTSNKPRTKYIRNEFSPVFNDEVCIKILKEEVDDQKMYLHVCDYNQISTRDLIGSYKLDLDDVSFKSKGKENVYEGDLRWIDSVRGAERGDILISMRYYSGNSQLIVKVKECKGLQPFPGKVSCNSYVKLHLVRGSKIITSKKTKVIKKNLEPNFDQEIIFIVQEDLLDEVNLVIHVKDKPLIGRKRLMGELCIGCQGVGQALAQWQLMVEKEVTMWHQLELLNIVPGKTDLQTTMATLHGWESTSEEESEEEEGMFTGLLPGGLFSSQDSKQKKKPKKPKLSKKQSKL